MNQIENKQEPLADLPLGVEQQADVLGGLASSVAGLDRLLVGGNLRPPPPQLPPDPPKPQ